MKGISAVMILHNGDRIKYPWREAIASIKPAVDELIVVLAGPHEDNTADQLVGLALDSDHIKIVYGPHDKDSMPKWKDLNDLAYYREEAVWPADHTGLSTLVNIGVEHVSSPWAMQVQADEIIDAVESGSEIAKIASLPPEVKAATFGFRHYCGDLKHIFPFVYGAVDFDDMEIPGYTRRVSRAIRVQSSWRFVGDAVQASGNGLVYNSKVLVHHVGKVHTGREEAAAFKEFMFQTQLYVGHAFAEPDPLVVEAYNKQAADFFHIFQTSADRIRPWAGKWPFWIHFWNKSLGLEELP